jgi:hypothetical protein
LNVDVFEHWSGDLGRRTILRRVARWTLLDEFLGFVYWAVAFVGIILAADRTQGALWLGVMLALYVPLVVLIYFIGVRRLSYWFKQGAGDG